MQNTPLHPILNLLLSCGNIHSDYSNDREIATDIKNAKVKDLESEISKEIQTQVKDTTNRFILIKGSNMVLAEAVAAYIYCLKGQSALMYHLFAGKDATQASAYFNSTYFPYCENKIFIKHYDLCGDCVPLDWVKHGASMVFSSFNYTDDILEDLDRVVSDIAKIKEARNDKGLLIVITRKDLPEYFTREFEVINLGSEKTAGTSIPGVVENIIQAQKKEKEIDLVEVPSGTKWEDITIKFVEKDVVLITVNNGNPLRKNLLSMGFKIDTLPHKILLYASVNVDGKIDVGKFKEITDDLKSQVSDIRKIIQAAFKKQDGERIPGDPIPWDYTYRCYKPKFKLTCTDDVKAYLESISKTQNTSHYEIEKKNPQRTSYVKGLKMSESENSNYASD